MNKPFLIVNGQALSTEISGGAGRYASKFLANLIAAGACGELREFEFLPYGFAPELEEGSRQGFNGLKEVEIRATCSKKLKALAKGALRQVMPQEKFNMLLTRYHAVMHGAFGNMAEGLVIKDFSVPDWIQADRPIMFHELTNYSGTKLLGRLGVRADLRLMTTFLDVQDLFYPKNFSDEVLTSRRLHYSYYKDRAELFFAISKFTKQSMVDRLGIPAAKILVTPLASDDMQPIILSPEMEKVISAYGKYWIYPAKMWKHKNHDFLFRVLAKRVDEFKKAKVKIFLTGGFSEDEVKLLSRLAVEHGVSSIVVFLGFLSEKDLHMLIQSADYMIFPSLFEGFGMPILEAMTLGCPVLASNATSIPEIGGDAAVYFDPNDLDSAICVVDAALSGRLSRQAMIEKGYLNSKRYTWRGNFTTTLEGYKSLL